MRICLDARKLWDSGIGSYIRGLLEGFHNISADLGWEFIVKPGAELPATLGHLQPRMHISAAGNYSLAELFSISRLVRQTQADLFHAPHYVLPFGLRKPAVVTVHDLIHLLFPQYFSLPQRAYARWMLGRVSRKAVGIIVVSERTKRDLIEILGASESKIEVVYNGIHPQFFNEPTPEAVSNFRRKHHWPENYLLYVGNLKPHKNVKGLIAAWSRLAASIRPPLVIVGAKIDEYNALVRQTDQLRLGEQIAFVGEIDPEELCIAYRLAAALVQPSWYEGFGFPPLEAMASGIPVAVSNRGSLPEVAADAALIFDPADNQQFVGSLERILTDNALRKTLIEKGKQKASQFTWTRCAEKTYQVYQRALEG